MRGKRILLVHLTSNGDCLMATTVARQIKSDYPGCHLTWAISYKCKQVLENNPFVDHIWPITHEPNEHLHNDVWPRVKAASLRRQSEGQLDLVFFTQIYPENFNNFDGTTRSSIFRSYPGKITVPLQPVLFLYQSEVDRVTEFAARHQLRRYKNVILFECSPASSQSLLTQETAIRISTRIAEARQDTAIVVSSHRSFDSESPAVIDGSTLTFRENAELSKHCTLLLGCSSGITWLLTSNWAKKIPTIQFLHRSTCWFSFASVKYDHQFWGLSTDHILETDRHSEADVVDLVLKFLSQGSFEGIEDVAFVPSLGQIHDLYRMRSGRLDTMRVLQNFTERNKRSSVSKVGFCFGQLCYEIRYGISGGARRVLSPAKSFVRAMHWITDEVTSRREAR